MVLELWVVKMLTIAVGVQLRSVSVGVDVLQTQIQEIKGKRDHKDKRLKSVAMCSEGNPRELSNETKKKKH
jgi:acyl-CoA hydrolase